MMRHGSDRQSSQADDLYSDSCTAPPIFKSQSVEAFPATFNSSGISSSSAIGTSYDAECSLLPSISSSVLWHANTTQGCLMSSPRDNRRSYERSLTEFAGGTSNNFKVIYEPFEHGILTTAASKASPQQIMCYIAALDTYISQHSSLSSPSSNSGSNAAPTEATTEATTGGIVPRGPNKSTAAMHFTLADWLRFIKHQNQLLLSNCNPSSASENQLEMEQSGQSGQAHHETPGRPNAPLSLLKENEAMALWIVFSAIVNHHHRLHSNSYNTFNWGSPCNTFCSGYCDRNSKTREASIGDPKFAIDIRFFGALLLLQATKSVFAGQPTSATLPRTQQQVQQYSSCGRLRSSSDPIPPHSSVASASMPSGNAILASQMSTVISRQAPLNLVSLMPSISSPGLHPAAAHVTSLSSPRMSPKSGKLSPRAQVVPQPTTKVFDFLPFVSFIKRNLHFILGILCRDYTISTQACSEDHRSATASISAEQLTILDIFFDVRLSLPCDQPTKTSPTAVKPNKIFSFISSNMTEQLSRSGNQRVSGNKNEKNIQEIGSRIKDCVLDFNYVLDAFYNLLQNYEAEWCNYLSLHPYCVRGNQLHSFSSMSLQNDFHSALRETSYYNALLEGVQKKTAILSVVSNTSGSILPSQQHIISPRVKGSDTTAALIRNLTASSSSIFPTSSMSPISVSIMDCNDCFIYVPFKASYAKISCCKESRIFLLAIEGVTTLSNCSRLTIHAATSCIKLENCYEIDLYLYSKTPPLLLGDTRSITLAPYNVILNNPHQISELQNADLIPLTQFVGTWSTPVIVPPLASKAAAPSLTQPNVTPTQPQSTTSAPQSSQLSSTASLPSTAHKGETSSILFLNPEMFTPLVLPRLNMEVPLGDNASNMGSWMDDKLYDVPQQRQQRQQGFELLLPQVYAEALKQKQQLAADTWLQIANIGTAIDAKYNDKTHPRRTSCSYCSASTASSRTKNRRSGAADSHKDCSGQSTSDSGNAEGGVSGKQSDSESRQIQQEGCIPCERESAKQRVHNILQKSFSDWLLSSGRHRELSDICRMEAESRTAITMSNRERESRGAFARSMSSINTAQQTASNLVSDVSFF